MQNVADHRAGRRCHHADHVRQKRNELLARLVEQALSSELLLALLQELHQRADAGGLQGVDDDLVFRGAGKRRELAGHDDVEAFFGLDPHAAPDALPDHAFQHRLVVLEAEIDVAGGRGPLEAGDLAAHPHIAVGILDGLAQRRRQPGDGPFHDVVEDCFGHGGRICCGAEGPCYTKWRASLKARPRLS